MSKIHPTAVVDPGAEVAAGTEIGPFCVIGKDVKLADGVKLMANVTIDGHTEIGSGTTVFPFAALGMAPQHLKYKGEPSRLIIGANNLIREHVTMNAGTEGGGICLVSSMLYKSALEAGLTIKERRAHSRPVRSIKPGLDATVDYGRYDLKFENRLAKPILIQTSCKDQIARVEIRGVNNDKTCTLVTSPIARTGNTLTIAVYKKLDGQLLPVSKDSYRR